MPKLALKANFNPRKKLNKVERFFPIVKELKISD